MEEFPITQEAFDIRCREFTMKALHDPTESDIAQIVSMLSELRDNLLEWVNAYPSDSDTSLDDILDDGMEGWTRMQNMITAFPNDNNGIGALFVLDDLCNDIAKLAADNDRNGLVAELQGLTSTITKRIAQRPSAS